MPRADCLGWPSAPARPLTAATGRPQAARGCRVQTGIMPQRMTGPRRTELTSGLFMMVSGSPSAIFRPKSGTVTRSTTERSACRTCSILMMVTPSARIAWTRDKVAAFGLGQPARDLVEQQQVRSRGDRASSIRLRDRAQAGAKEFEPGQPGQPPSYPRSFLSE